MDTVAISTLVLDKAFCPRVHVNPMNVNRIADAMQAGITLPPIIVDRGTMRVLDGWHRVAAVKKLSGDDGEILAELRDYGSEAEAFLEAVALNSTHGLALSEQDAAHTAILAEELGIDKYDLSKALARTPVFVEGVYAKRLAVREGGRGKFPLKRAFKRLANQELTQAQEAVNKRHCGPSLYRLAEDLERALSSGMYDAEDQRLVNALRVLQATLNNIVTGE